mgnify:CR=1 FL=1
MAFIPETGIGKEEETGMESAQPSQETSQTEPVPDVRTQDQDLSGTM